MQQLGPPPARRDLLVAAAVVLAAGALFASTFSTNVAGGDAPESVMGVREMGVLHAPGYPSYVIAARAFGTLLPFGGWASRVNLFSLGCASCAVGCVYLLARAFGARVVGAVLGALALATTASFWFYAGYAKHYAFSGLLVAATAVLVLRWERTDRKWPLIVAALLLGICFGASWELAAIMLAGIVAYAASSRRRPAVRTVVAGGGVMVFTSVATYCFVLIRARAHPYTNWGEATSISRVVNLVVQRDFRTSAAPGVHATASTVPGRMAMYLGIIARDMGLVAVALAVIGVVVVATRVPRNRQAFLAMLVVANLAAVAYVTGLSSNNGFQGVLVAGGFLVDALIAVAVLAALGITWLLEQAVERAADQLAIVGERASRSVFAISAAALAAVLLVPSVLVHYSHANHRTPPLVDLYGRRVLEELPPRAVLAVMGTTFGFPISYRQQIFRERPDVDVVDLGGLAFDWYRQQLARRLRLNVPAPSKGASIADSLPTQISEFLTQVATTRPTYVDQTAMVQLYPFIGYRTQGYVGQFVSGAIGGQPVPDAKTVAATLAQADAADGLRDTSHLAFPNDFIYWIHERAHIELAKQYLAQSNNNAAIPQLQQALTLLPYDTATRSVLNALENNTTVPPDVIKSL